MSKFLCPCGQTFTPAVWGDHIQILCSRCSLIHDGRGDAAHAWLPDSNVLALLPRVAPSVVKGAASGVVGGEVGGVTPVPLRRFDG